MRGLLLLPWVACATAQVVPSAPSAYGASPSLDTQPRESAGSTQRTQQRAPPVQFRITMEETFTDNVRLDPSDTRQSDLVTRIAPGVRLQYNGGRVTLRGDISAPILLYARTGSENNRVVPQVNVLGRVEAVERLFFVEAAANVSQSYFTPFSPTSSAIENNPNNAYTAHSYRVSPYVVHTTGDYSYELRDDSTWSTVNGAPVSTSNAYTNDLRGHFTRAPRPFGWSLDYQRTDVNFAGDVSQITELSRARLLLKPDPDLEVFASGGYEKERFPFADHDGFIYGTGGRWRPNARVRLDASWEHRFFGSAYRVSFQDRTPLTVWSLEASRDISSYPQLLAELGAGDVASLLDQLFSSRIPDAGERQQFVQQVIQERGLPTTLSDAINIFTRNVRIDQRVGASVGLLGARNTVFLRVYRQRTEPVAGDEIIDNLADFGVNSTQTGGTLVWTHRLAAGMQFSASAEQRYARANTAPYEASRQSSFVAALSYALTPDTTLRGGARVQRQRTDISPGYDEAAVFVIFSHLFR